jgi:hypothetical protein
MPPLIVRERKLASLCPRDPRAQGTWVGANEKGVVAAITNRPAPNLDPARRSRGQLLLDLLGQPTALQACEWLRGEMRRRVYNPFNVVLADEVGGIAFHAPKGGIEGLEEHPLGAGSHLLTNEHDLDTLEIDGLAEAGDVERVEDALENVKEILGDHAVRGGHSLCKHDGLRRTLSSTLVAIGEGGLESGFFLHAEGAPCKTPFRDHSRLLRHLSSAEDRRAAYGHARGERGGDFGEEDLDEGGDRPRRPSGSRGRGGR